MKNLRYLARAAVAAMSILPAMAGHILQPAHHGAGPPGGGTTPPVSTLPAPPNFASCNFTVPTSFTHVWYIDPVNGQTGNAMTTAGVSTDPTVNPHQGDVTHPFKDINALDTTATAANTLGYPSSLIPGGRIKGGDEVLLQSGTAAQYGAVGFGINGFFFNTSGPYITIKAAPGATVTFGSLSLDDVNYLSFSGINVQNTGKFPLVKVSVGTGGNNVMFNNMNISTTDPTTAQSWTQAQWAAASNGVQFTPGTCVSMTNSHIFNVATGVAFAGGTKINFQGNQIDHISQDGMDLCGLDENIVGNSIHDFPNSGSGDHIDAIQGVVCVPSIPTDQRIAINNNTIIWRTDPNLPFPTGSLINGAIDWGGCCWTDMQAINNTIYWTNFVHGISLDSTTNAIIENNTLAGGYIVTNGGVTNTLVKNNITSGMDCKGVATGVQMQNNIMYKGGNPLNIVCFNGTAPTLSTASGTYLGNNIVDTGGVLSELTAINAAVPFAYNFNLVSTAPARGFGLPVDFSPAVDSLGNPMNTPPDVGAVQFQQAAPPPPPPPTDPTVGVLPAYNDAYANWQNAGMAKVGDFPARTTQCGATLTPSGGDDLSQITAAIAACPTGDVLQLGPGTFQITMAEYIFLNKSITIRGTGACNNGSSPYCQTVVTVSNGTVPVYGGARCGSVSARITCQANPVFFVAPQAVFLNDWTGCNFGVSCTGNSGTFALAADAAQGQTTVQLAATSGLSVGMFVRIDEASAAVSGAGPAGGTLFAAPDLQATSGSPATGKIAYAGSSVEDGAPYGALHDRETSEIHLISSVGSGPCPGTSCTVTFDSPLTIAYRQSGNHSAQVYAPNHAFLQEAAIENLTITRATQNPIIMMFCAYCWVKGIETSMWDGGIVFSNSVRGGLSNSYLHDCGDCENNGAEYPIALDGATTEMLVTNNIITLSGKGMVGRSSGGGNVVAYNYVDKTFYEADGIGNWWVETSLNGSHYTGSHHTLFEGNWADNCDNDNTHGNVVYHTYFRNWCTGLRSNFTDPSLSTSTSTTFNAADAAVSDLNNIGYAGGNPYPYTPDPRRAAGMMSLDYWMAFVGNVLGESGVTTTANGWSYQISQQANSDKHMWMLGWGGVSTQDAHLTGAAGSYFFRHGNFDYVNNSIADWTSGFSHTLPNSFYLSSAPAFFSGGASCTYTWPWVTPTGASPIGGNSCSGSGLPAKARADAGTPFVQP